MKKQYLTFEQKQNRIQDCFQKALIKIKEANNLSLEISSEDIRDNDLFQFIEDVIKECGAHFILKNDYWKSSLESCEC